MAPPFSLSDILDLRIKKPRHLAGAKPRGDCSRIPKTKTPPAVKRGGAFTAGTGRPDAVKIPNSPDVSICSVKIFLRHYIADKSTPARLNRLSTMLRPISSRFSVRATFVRAVRAVILIRVSSCSTCLYTP